MKKKIGTILLVAGVLTCAYGLLFEHALTLVYGVCSGLFGSLFFIDNSKCSQSRALLKGGMIGASVAAGVEEGVKEALRQDRIARGEEKA
jgi:hypothetical protein